MLDHAQALEQGRQLPRLGGQLYHIFLTHQIWCLQTIIFGCTRFVDNLDAQDFARSTNSAKSNGNYPFSSLPVWLDEYIVVIIILNLDFISISQLYLLEFHLSVK